MTITFTSPASTDYIPGGRFLPFFLNCSFPTGTVDWSSPDPQVHFRNTTTSVLAGICLGEVWFEGNTRDVTIHVQKTGDATELRDGVFHFTVFKIEVSTDKIQCVPSGFSDPDPAVADQVILATATIMNQAGTVLPGAPVQFITTPRTFVYFDAVSHLPLAQDALGYVTIPSDATGKAEVLIGSKGFGFSNLSARAPDYVAAGSIVIAATSGKGGELPVLNMPIDSQGVVNIPENMARFDCVVPFIEVPNPINYNLAVVLNGKAVWYDSLESAQNSIQLAYALLDNSGATNEIMYFVEDNGGVGNPSLSGVLEFTANGEAQRHPDSNAKVRITSMVPYLDDHAAMVNKQSVLYDLGVNIDLPNDTAANTARAGRTSLTVSAYINAFHYGTTRANSDIVDSVTVKISQANITAGKIRVTLDRNRLLGFAASSAGEVGKIEFDYRFDDDSAPEHRYPETWLTLPIDTVGLIQQ